MLKSERMRVAACKHFFRSLDVDEKYVTVSNIPFLTIVECLGWEGEGLYQMLVESPESFLALIKMGFPLSFLWPAMLSSLLTFTK